MAETAENKWHEECGVYGVYSRTADVTGLTCLGLQALQHRGQESCGIACTDGAWMDVTRGMGLVNEVFRQQIPIWKTSISLSATCGILLPAPVC